MIITKKAMPRRTVLKSAHAVLALPLLDAMIPAATALGEDPGQTGARGSDSCICRWAATTHDGRRRARNGSPS